MDFRVRISPSDVFNFRSSLYLSLGLKYPKTKLQLACNWRFWGAWTWLGRKPWTRRRASRHYLNEEGEREFGASNGAVSFQIAQLLSGPDCVPVSLVIYIDGSFIKHWIPVKPILRYVFQYAADQVWQTYTRYFTCHTHSVKCAFQGFMSCFPPWHLYVHAGAKLWW
jgi:hypothetical protein